MNVAMKVFHYQIISFNLSLLIGFFTLTLILYATLGTITCTEAIRFAIKKDQLCHVKGKWQGKAIT
jgi:hypothetical protein